LNAVRFLQSAAHRVLELERQAWRHIERALVDGKANVTPTSHGDEVVLAKGPNLHEPMNALSGRFAAISETEFETEYRDHWMLAAHPDSQPLNRHVSPQLSISSFDEAAIGAARRFER